MKSEYQRINNEEERYYLVSASHGIEECTCQGNNYIDAIINAADEKMYTEKRKIKKDIQIIRRDRMKKPE
jgi:GGDEF domain-containing protein